ncbi:MAG: hypothetical protein ACR2H6_06125 [Pyrinomonadaceae bacterium]
MSDIPTLQSIVDWANNGVVIALAVSFIAGGASIFLSKRLGRLKDEQYAHEKQASDEKVAALELRAQELARQNLEMRSVVANLEKEAADAKRAYLELQLRERKRVRRLTPEQAHKLREFFKGKDIPAKRIELQYPVGNNEAYNFGDDLFMNVLMGLNCEATKPIPHP